MRVLQACSLKFNLSVLEQEACEQCKARDKKWIWIGCSLKGNSEFTEWRRAEIDPVNESLPLSLSQDMALLSGVEMPKHLLKLPSWSLQLYGLETLDLTGCSLMESIPHDQLIHFPFLRSLNLSGCVKLWSPPQEICNQGGEAALQFLRRVEKSGKFNKTMNLLLLGDGEAGKTSVIMALKSESNRAVYIRADHRTVGIDISTCRLEDTDFRIYDFAGQPVYTKTHQHFLLTRALYVYVWRALPGSSNMASIEKSIRFWLESLQNRMPGLYVMLVVTHIDQVDADTLQMQIEFVQSTVREWLAELSGRVGNGCEINQLKVWNQGKSIPVDCLSGYGVSLLKEAVHGFSSAMPWYREALPSEWLAFQESLVLHRVRNKFLSWSVYSRLAAKNGVLDDTLPMVTKYLHESGFIQYFGDFCQPKPTGTKSSDFLNDFVFISCPWMIGVMKGLLCHERQALMDFLLLKQDKEMLIHLNALNKYGTLNKALLPFLWPSRSQCPEFWEYLCSQAKREREIWKHTIISCEEDLECALAVLDGFDQLTAQGNAYLVPGALAPAQFPSTPALDCDECPYRWVFHYAALPPGALDTIFVRTAKTGCRCAQITPFMAVFYDKAGDICQIFCFEEQGASNMQKLVVRSSSMQFLSQAEQQVLKMEKQFGGLQRLHRSQREQTSLVASKQFIWKTGDQIFSPSQEIVCSGCLSSHQLNAHVFNKSVFVKDWLLIFRVCEGSSTQETECPVCHSKHRVLDILTTCRVSDLERRQCPCCTHFGNDTDSFFSSAECRRQLILCSKEERDVKTVTCFECMHRSRTGQIRVLDFVQEEVYISGLCALGKSLQRSVENCLYHIELEAGIGCSERLVGLKGSLVVVILLSDSYIHSEQCIQEFISAFRSRQSLLPILLPYNGKRNEQGIPVGWTGSADSEYWQHAVSIGSGNGSVDWSLLRHFAPLQYPFTLTSDEPMKKDYIDFARQVTSRINACIQRDGKANTYSEISILGVKLSYFDKFIAKFGGEGIFLGLTTEQVMHRFVKPATEQTRLSLCELLMSQGLESEVGRSEWFYSHASKCFFLDTVSALKSFFEGSGADPVIWFDVFSVSHHKTETRPFEWWNSVFLPLIGNIGNVLLFLQPYEDPKSGTPAWIMLTRLWCVYEIYAGAVTFGRIEVAMTEEMSTKFLADLHADPATVLSILESFDCANCVASNKEDEERVFEVITKSAGFPALNSAVLGVMERWLYGALLSPQHSCQPQQGEQPALDVMETICRRGLQLREQRLGADHPDTANSRRILLVIRRAQTDPAFLGSLVERGWRAHELEEFQREQDAKAAEEERLMQQKADEIARLVAEEESERRAAEERRKEEEKETIIRQTAAANAAPEEEDPPVARLAGSRAAQAKPKCCSIA